MSREINGCSGEPRFDCSRGIVRKEVVRRVQGRGYDEMHSIILIYEGDYEEPWTRFDIPRIIDSVTGWIDEDGIFVVSDEGDVYDLSAGTAPQHGKVEGTGVYSEDAAGLGYTNRIVSINDTLLITRHNSQLYIRNDGRWT